MKTGEIIDKLKAFHPPVDADHTVDKLLVGSRDTEVTGIAITLQPTPEVIRRAAAAGCNLLMCHEPTWFNGMDLTEYVENDPVYLAKRKLLEETGVQILRNHDHVHAHTPDLIAEGVAQTLGWKPYREEEKMTFKGHYQLPATTARGVAEELKTKLKLNGLRLIGDPDTPVRRVVFSSHMGFLSQKEDLDAIAGADLMIPGEVLDFSALSYAREASQLGLPKAILNIGHYNLERMGMVWAETWMKQLFGEALPVLAIDSGDPYVFL